MKILLTDEEIEVAWATVGYKRVLAKPKILPTDRAMIKAQLKKVVGWLRPHQACARVPFGVWTFIVSRDEWQALLKEVEGE